ncbi:hypothetical protein ACIBUY_41130 [Streptomyces sp. NPDC050085]|uniref:hypothetical protein n=1 Tax=Streptomyces sp. NPDC050085 TaxID=3365600 RepID=UPI00379D8552
MDDEQLGGPVPDFCRELLVMMRAAGVRQAQLAREMKKSEAAVSDLLHGKLVRPPDWEDVKAVVEFCARRRGVEGEELDDTERRWRRRHEEMVDAAARAPRRPAGPAPYRVESWELQQVPGYEWAHCLEFLARAGGYPLHGRTALLAGKDRAEVREGVRGLCQDALDRFPARVRGTDRAARSAVCGALVVVACEAALLDVDRDVERGSGPAQGTAWVGTPVAEVLERSLVPDNPASRVFVGAGQDHARVRELLEAGDVFAPLQSLPPRSVSVLVPRFLEILAQVAAHEPELWLHARMWDRLAPASGTSLDGLAEALTPSPDPAPYASDAARRLSRLPARTLDRSLVEGTQGQYGVAIPSLGVGYVDPAVRTTVVEGWDAVHDDAWWRTRSGDHGPLHALLAAHFTSADAVCRPLVVLGHPGVGKSLLTRILMARLPASDFLPVRVELRAVDADAPLREQIEEAIAGQLPEPQSWHDVVRGAAGRLPVVLLDGLDELIQAGEFDHSDYLERVQQFQEEEAADGRPVAVVVTSRTVVVDRCRIPVGCRAVYLRTFDIGRRNLWLDTWNRVNRGYFAAHGLSELTPGALAPYDELACQPLLLLLLALYDAADNDLARLRRSTVTGAQLYEQLLLGFVRRQVRKHHRHGRSPEAVEEEAEAEMARLGVVALAMFNRGRQSVRGADVAEDAGALLGTAQGWTDDRAFGRFFFVHEAQAVRHGRSSRAYEFLHATFSEYLVARSIWQELRTVAETGDDARLSALLSFALLTERAQVMERLEECVDAADPELRKALRAALPRFLARCLDCRAPDEEIPYAPRKLPRLMRLAHYTANLALVHVLVAGEPLASELVGDAEVPAAWRRLAGLWETQLDAAGWEDLTRNLHAVRTWLDPEGTGTGRRDMLLRLSRGGQPDVHSVLLPEWTLSKYSRTGLEPDTVARRAVFGCRADGDLFAQGISAGWFRPADPFRDQPRQLEDEPPDESDGRDMAALLTLARGLGPAPVQVVRLEQLYERCADALLRARSAAERAPIRCMLVRALARDQQVLSGSFVARLLPTVIDQDTDADLGSEERELLKRIESPADSPSPWEREQRWQRRRPWGRR